MYNCTVTDGASLFVLSAIHVSIVTVNCFLLKASHLQRWTSYNLVVLNLQYMSVATCVQRHCVNLFLSTSLRFKIIKSNFAPLILNFNCTCNILQSTCVKQANRES